jgi:hypothetical protein
MGKNLDQPTNAATWKRGNRFSSAPLDSDLLSRELYTADPVREGAAYPRQRNYHGFYWMAAVDQHVWHESLLERDCLMWLDFALDVVAVASQPVRLTGSDGVHRYPDFLTLEADGRQTVYDVKPMARINTKVREQFAWTRTVCESVGWVYRILTDPPPQFKVNLTWLSQFRHPGHHPGADVAEELVAAARPDWTIHDAVRAMPAPSTARARSNVFHLIWTGAFNCDMRQRLSERTALTTTASPARKEYPHALA